MRDVSLLCEGTHGQIDQRVLDLLVVTAHGVPARVRPVGGSSSLKAMAQFIEQESSRGASIKSVVPPVIFTVRDRDFKSLAFADSTWADPTCRDVIWRRHEIENYLVEPSVIHSWFESLRHNPPHNMLLNQLPTTVGQVERLVESLADASLEHHAGQLVFEEMQQSYRCYTDTTSLARPKKSGAVSLTPNRLPPPGRTAWLNALNSEWRRVQINRRRIGRIPDWTANKIRSRFDSISAALRQPSYFSAKTYLLDFEGKGLVWALWNRIQQMTGLSISLDIMKNELIRALPATYNRFHPYQPDEFRILASRMISASI